MTHLLLDAGPVGLRIAKTDARHGDESFHGSEVIAQPPVLLQAVWTDDGESLGWATPWWPSRGALLGSSDGASVDSLFARAPWWSEVWVISGANGRLGFAGYTRDASGNIVAGCIVRCFNTATNELVAMVTSDANGFYLATTPYADGHYLVVHKSGSPEIAGASVSNLLPG